MAASQYKRTRSGKLLPHTDDFREDIFRAVEDEWLVYAKEELLFARWVTAPSKGGRHTTVKLQKDDGRSHGMRVSPNPDTTGYHLLFATKTHPSLPILTIEDMVEAVYRHWLARGSSEWTQEIFVRRFGAKYEGTRREDLNWIIKRIKDYTKVAPALEEELAAYIAPQPTSVSEVNTAAPNYAIQPPASSEATVRQPTTPSRNCLPGSTSTTATRQAPTTPQYADQSPSKRRDTASNTTTKTPLPNQRTAMSTPSRVNNPATAVPNTADVNGVSLSESKKRGTTISMDFSERLPSRRRFSESEESIWADFTAAASARQKTNIFDSADRYASSTTQKSYKSSANTSHHEKLGDSNANMVSPSRYAGVEPRTEPRLTATIPSMTAGKDSKSRGGVISANSISASRKEGVPKYPGASNGGKKPEIHGYSGSWSSSLNIEAGQEYAVSKKNGATSDSIATKTDLGTGRGSKGNSTSIDCKKMSKEATAESRNISTTVSKGSNKEGNNSIRPKGFAVEGSSRVRSKAAGVGSSTGALTMANSGSRQGSGAVPEGSLLKFNKDTEGINKPGDAFTTTVKSTGYTKIDSGVHKGSNAVGFLRQKDSRSHSTPQVPRSGPGEYPTAQGPRSSFGPGKISTPGSSGRNVYNSGAPPGLNFRKRETPNSRYENNPVDATAHLYTGNPEPEKYSAEWQERRLTLGLHVELPVNAGQSSSPVNKTQTAAPAGLIGVLNAINNWDSGNTNSKKAPVANMSTPTRNVSRAGGGTYSGSIVGVHTSSEGLGISTSVASGNNFPKAPPTGPSENRAPGIFSGNRAVSSGYCSPSAHYTPSKAVGELATLTNKATPNKATPGNSSPAFGSVSGYPWETPTKPAGSTSLISKPPPTGPRNFSGSSYASSSKFGDSPPTGPAGWKDNGAFQNGYRSSRPRPAPAGDSYRPSYADSDGPPAGRYDNGPRADHRSCPDYRSDRESPPYSDFRSRSGYNDRHHDSRYRH